jgi:hypothetical protein
MSATYEVYTDVECPRCGYTEARDAGPYEPDPLTDDELGGPTDPRVHLMWCGRCGGPFDVAPAEDIPDIIKTWSVPEAFRKKYEKPSGDAA